MLAVKGIIVDASNLKIAILKDRRVLLPRFQSNRLL